VYCQIIDKLYPGTVTMGKIKWDAKFDYQYMDNYKILNAGFKKNGIQKVPDVDKLIKARY
jgi:RP/EB family microtubule-associated protein